MRYGFLNLTQLSSLDLQVQFVIFKMVCKIQILSKSQLKKFSALYLQLFGPKTEPCP